MRITSGVISLFLACAVSTGALAKPATHHTRTHARPVARTQTMTCCCMSGMGGMKASMGPNAGMGPMGSMMGGGTAKPGAMGGGMMGGMSGMSGGMKSGMGPGDGMGPMGSMMGGMGGRAAPATVTIAADGTVYVVRGDSLLKYTPDLKLVGTVDLPQAAPAKR